MGKAMEDVVRRGRFWRAALEQGKWWWPDSRPAILVADMDDRWRRNAAAWLLRQAATVEFYYAAAEAEWLARPMVVAIGEIDGKPVERLDREATMAPTEGSMAADALAREQEARAADPQAWLKATPLYKALLNGI